MTAEIPFNKTMEFAYGVPRELAPGIVRLVANNPSPFTFHGTNTYLIGSRELALIDPGPEDEAHFEAIMRTAAGRPITHIFITHTHRDHTDGLDRIREATGAKICARGRSLRGPGSLKTSPSGAEFIDIDFKPDIVMGDGDVVAGPDWRLEALFTPGHAPDHLCFAEASSNVLFCGDHVMGWNTSVVAPPEGNMTDYMRSLEKLLERSEPVFLPGHGGRIEQPSRMVKAYIVHRRWREQAILDAVRQGHITIDRIVAAVYQGLDPRLVRAASLSVLAHIESLVDRGLVNCDGPPDLDRPVSAA
ncbi:MAG TPA: MBL fold metallo-hydrolase [Hyphomicrobiaceae bacterium]|jgi:glyoxylase-like metal-dependent hydrolase (beta-lactamase superfamily II)